MKYFYVVATVNGGRYFINKDMDYTDNFDEVLKFDSREDADWFICHHNLSDRAKVLEYKINE